MGAPCGIHMHVSAYVDTCVQSSTALALVGWMGAPGQDGRMLFAMAAGKGRRCRNCQSQSPLLL